MWTFGNKTNAICKTLLCNFRLYFRVARHNEAITTITAEDKMSHNSNQTVCETDSTDVIFTAFATIQSFISNHTGPANNYTNTRDVRSDLVSLASNFVELVMNGTNDVTGDIIDSITSILTHISNHRESMINDTDVENVRTSFACILSFYSDLEMSVNMTDCLLFRITILLIIGIVSGLGIIGNVASFFIFGKMAHQNSSTLLLRALAVMDSTFLLFAILVCCGYLGIYSAAFSFLYFRPAFYAIQIIAVWTSVLLGVNRYIVVCRPFLASRVCTVSNVWKQLAVVIFLSSLYAFPSFFEIETVNLELNDDNDTTDPIRFRPWAENYYYDVIYRSILNTTLLFAAPLLVQLICSIRLSNTLYAARRERQEMSGQISNADKYVTRLVLVVMIVFLICYTPVVGSSVLWILLGKKLAGCADIILYYQEIALLLIVLNSSVNCIIYVTFNPSFRKTLKSTISCDA